MHVDLVQLALEKVTSLGPDAAAEYFGLQLADVLMLQAGDATWSATALQKVLDEFTELHDPVVWDIQKQILILMPIYREVNGKTMVTLLRNISLYGRDKVGFIPKFRTLISEARCSLAEMALTTSSEWFIYIDGDSVLPCGHRGMLRGLGCTIADPMASHVTLTRLMSHPVDKLIVSALVFSRHGEKPRAACSDGWDSAASNEYLVNCRLRYQDTLKPQRWVGMACTRIHRSVFEKFKEAAGKEFPEILPSKEGRHYGYFVSGRPDTGEDAAFCKRAKKIGIDCYVDCGLPIGHVGERIF